MSMLLQLKNGHACTVQAADSEKSASFLRAIPSNEERHSPTRTTYSDARSLEHSRHSNLVGDHQLSWSLLYTHGQASVCARARARAQPTGRS